MRPSTEEFLYFLLWTADTLARPTWRNIHDGFESWAWRSGLGRRVAELQRLQLIEGAPADLTGAIVRLTTAGKRAALGGRDPEECWARPWDGRWRMVLFDIPERQRRIRWRLWRFFRANRFGFLQNSVWITPDPFSIDRLRRVGPPSDVEYLILIEGRPAGNETDAAIVRGAWDFDGINAAYRRHGKVLDARPREVDQFRRWSALERRAWSDATRRDPLLPSGLLPSGYLGRTAWTRRTQVLAELAVEGGAAAV
jgi:phenylacetic acid degradation operon negative regulatory protein